MTKQRVRIVSYGTVLRVEERVARKHLRGAGKDAQFLEKSEGWYVVLVEQPSAVHFGADKPDIVAGDKIKITVEKV